MAAVNLASALERVREIEQLPAGYRDPKLADDAPHLSAPWVPLPGECLGTVRAFLTRLDAERLPMPTEIRPIAPYMGDGGIGLHWRDAHLGAGQGPAVFLGVTLVGGTTCTRFERDFSEHESHAPGYGVSALADVYPFLAEALAWWVELGPTQNGRGVAS